jgi:hypothetical protein
MSLLCTMTGYVPLYRKCHLSCDRKLSEYDAVHAIHLPRYGEMDAATAVLQSQLQVFPDGLLPVQSRTPHASIITGGTGEAFRIRIQAQLMAQRRGSWLDVRVLG